MFGVKEPQAGVAEFCLLARACHPEDPVGPPPPPVLDAQVVRRRPAQQRRARARQSFYSASAKAC
eukprot:6067193-Lingulodinium_polyedra.AAC.1